MPDGQWAPVPDIPGVPEVLCREGAFVPPPLPLDLTLPSTTYRRAAEAEHVLGRLDEAAKRLRAPQGLVRSTQVRDAQSSASLGGLHLGLEEVLAADLLASQSSPRRPDLIPRVTRYLQAYDHGIDRVRAGARVDATLMSELSAIMTGQAGRAVSDVLRTEHGLLGGGITGPYLLTAIGPHLLDRLEQLSDWAENDKGQPRVAQLAIAHYQLEVLQPFPTANGHVARGFSMLQLIRQRLLHSQILPLSVWLDDTLDEYQEQVRAVVDTGLIHNWVDYFSTAIRDQANAQLNLISRLDELAVEFADRAPKSGKILQVIADLISYPVINHRAIEERYKVTTKYATDLTRRLIDLDILAIWETPRYDQIFLCEPALDLLNLNEETRADDQRDATR